MYAEIDASGFADAGNAALMCGKAVRPGETPLQAAERNAEGQTRMRLAVLSRSLILEAALEQATKGQPTATDLWDTITDLFDAKGALHKSDFLAAARRHGLR